MYFWFTFCFFCFINVFQINAVTKIGRKNLLTRCDKLLNSIAEITTTTSESQPSPVSVLDSSFYRDEFSPIKRCNNFNGRIFDTTFLFHVLWSSTTLKRLGHSYVHATSITDICQTKWPAQHDVVDALQSIRFMKASTYAQFKSVFFLILMYTFLILSDQSVELEEDNWSSDITSSIKSELILIWSMFRKYSKLLI
ncbi:hypothetical protein IFM89_025898 [Coptis chinensis]|uniref:Uncharacterized protein n=1 Tax=Coptis chinensis TaxID=261450 RepID=A0A835HUY6_9MAGN|nr:hypothetical protein IFM89_025898 [Coptis chinensis]